PAEGLVLSGSCSEATRAQVAEYIKSGAPSYRLDPLALAEEGTAPVLAWLKEQSLGAMPLVYATAAPTEVALVQERLGVTAAGQLVEDALAQVARAAFAQGAARFVVAGGETSGAVTKTLGVDHLDIGPEIAPGVPWTFCESEGRAIALTLKSGNFGDVQFFTKACSVLEQL
ncbi:MAG: nucleotide-binding domain containing protein, partial [Pseudomonadota bacterium]